MTVTEFLIATLAVWRVSRHLRKEEGPWFIVKKVRDELCATYCHCRAQKEENSLCLLMTCNKCLGFWLSVFATIVWVLCDPGKWSFPMWFAMPWAISAATFVPEYLDEIWAVHAKVGWVREQDFDAKEVEVNA